MSISSGTRRLLGGSILVLAVSLAVGRAEEAATTSDALIKKYWDKINPFIRERVETCRPYLFRTYEAYWAETAPAIDGKTDDACWQEAQVATDFFKHGFSAITDDKAGLPPKPQNQTEVRLTYDAENIYVFYTLFERDMSQLVEGQPQDYQDVLDVHADAIELFLHPVHGDDRADKEIAANMDYYQICANPRGSTYTARAYADRSWNAERLIATQIDDDHWTVEMSIPIRDLYRGDGQAGTPKKGEIWGVLFCRDQALHHDWSRWTSSGIQSSGGFHDRQSFGRLVFQGRRDGAAVPEAQVSLGSPLTFGDNEFRVSLPPAMDGTVTVSCDGRVSWEQKLGKGLQDTVKIPVSAGGAVLVQMVLAENGKVMQAFYARKALPRAVEELNEIVAQTTDAAEAFSSHAKGWPEGDSVLKKAKSLRERAKESLRIFSGNQVSGKDVDTYNALRKDWKSFAFDAACANAIIATQPAPGSALAVQPLRATVKVFQNGFDKQGLLNAVELPCAGNEYESFQIVLTPLWKDLDNVKIELSPLEGEHGVVSAEHVSWFRVDYIEMDMDCRQTLPGFDPDDPESMRWWPDILWPGTPEGFSVPKGRYTGLWVDVFCPPGTKAGAYQGAISVHFGDETVSIPLSLSANGLELPGTPSLRNNHWYSTAWIERWARQHKVEMDKTSSMDILRRQIPVLQRYRVATYPMDMWHLLDSTLEDDGRFTFDFARMDEAIDYCRQRGANWICTSFGCNPGGIAAIYSGQQPVTIRATGEKVSLSKCPPMAPYYPAPAKTAEEKANEQARVKDLLDRTVGSWRGTPFAIAFYRAFTEYLRNKGLLEASYFEANDEAGPDVIIPFWHAFKQIAPDLPIMNYGPSPTRKVAGLSSEGYQDLWAPGLNKFDDPAAHERMQKRRVKYGEKFGFYVCGSMPPDAEGRYAPFLKPNESALGPRLLPWFAWKYGCDHFLAFMMFAGMTPTQWPVEAARTGGGGYAPMFFPLNDWSLVPAMRTAHLRDGMEDYEYFKLLHQRAGRLDHQFPPHLELLERIEKELEVEADIAAGHLDWTKDIRLLDAKRERIVKLVREAEDAITRYRTDAKQK